MTKLKHTKQQQLVVLCFLSKNSNNDLLKLEIRERLKGENHQLKKFIKTLSVPDIDEQTALKLLKLYCHLFAIKTTNLKTINDSIIIENEKLDSLKNELYQHLTKIGLPT